MGALRLFLTGAGSYTGLAAAEAAIRAGHDLVLHSRHGHRVDWTGQQAVTAVTGALETDALTPQMAGCDAVIHVAGRMRGTEAEFARDVVDASRHVMRAAKAAGVGRVVLAGSVSVYGAPHPGAVITEDSALEPRPDLRDGYTRAKLTQEAAMREEAGDVSLGVLRLGAIWGPGRLWNAHVGLAKGALLLRIGRDGQIPLCEVDRAGEALIKAVDAAPAVLNVLDDDLPDRVRFLAALSYGGGPKIVLPISWRLLDSLARDRAGGPGLLRRPVLRARMMPLGWDARRAVSALFLLPQPGFEALMAANLAEGSAS